MNKYVLHQEYRNGERNAGNAGTPFIASVPLSRIHDFIRSHKLLRIEMNLQKIYSDWIANLNFIGFNEI